MSIHSDAPVSGYGRPGFRGGRIPDGISDGLGGMAPYLRLAKMQGELDAMRQYLWCVARQQGGVLTVTAAELAECPHEARLSARRGPEGSTQVAALDADSPADEPVAGS